MKFIWNYFIWIWPPNFIWTSYELHEKLPDNSCIFPTKFVRSSYEVLVKFIWIESFCYICISSEVHVNFIWNSYVIMCEISKWPWFSYVFHSKFIWHTDQNFQMKFHTNNTNRPSYHRHWHNRVITPVTLTLLWIGQFRERYAYFLGMLHYVIAMLDDINGNVRDPNRVQWTHLHWSHMLLTVDDIIKAITFYWNGNLVISWWRHQMETFSALMALCAGNSPVTGEFPAQRPVTQSIEVFFDLRLNKWLSKQSWGWWFETPSRSLWRHCNVFVSGCNGSGPNDISGAPT